MHRDNQGLDYKKLGFRCGLEIHQQLEGSKLFCNCPTLNSAEKADYGAMRKLRAVVGETGKIDIAAAHEMGKGRTFLYESHSSDTCLVEYDEEPPFPLDREALGAGLRVALLLNAKIVDEIHVMRKIVIDGSNVTGFQRTALIALDGWIETSEGRVGIPLICLEEEAAQKLGEGEGKARYKLDRLGIPLLEIATSASIRSAEHAKEVASRIGMVLRSVEGVRRGLGTIRQDVNISIEKGARTEIKGFQELRSIPKVIEFEVRRQQHLISEGKKLSKEVRKAEPDFTTSFLRPLPGAARLYPETDVLPVKVSKEQIRHIRENLPKLRDERIKELMEGYKLPHDVAKEAAEDGRFEAMAGRFRNIPPQLVAQTLFTTPKELKSRLNLDPSKLSEGDYEEVFGYLDQGKIAKDAVIELLARKIRGEKIDVSRFAGISDEELEGEIRKIVAEKPGLSAGGYMGLVMAKFRGKAEGKKVMEILRKLMGD
ncbi:TPA: Glu-tRNA(Gln) amidotransferase subunit GatE [Candidatus Woesearchaeota archaeon]|nr:Glu-tRNA(Gln) amidotransferase subunit GatE [Candidatus Woesearchaeota archaeon]